MINLFSILFENSSVIEPKHQDLLDAIQHADINDEGWTLDNFDLKYLGKLTLNQLSQYDDLSSWLETNPGDELDDWENFRGKKWQDMAIKWGKDIPPVIVITAPDEGKLRTQIGDGRGRINYMVAMGIKTMPVFELEFKEERISEANFNNSLLKRMGYEFSGKNYRIGSDSFVYKNDPDKKRSKKIIKAVNKNLSKKDYLHDPPAMGISLPKKSKG